MLVSSTWLGRELRALNNTQEIKALEGIRTFYDKLNVIKTPPELNGENYPDQL